VIGWSLKKLRNVFRTFKAQPFGGEAA
jgi:hypothetical protein